MKLRAVGQVARKKLGFRYRISTVPLNPAGVSGSHGRLPAHPDDGPVLLCSTSEPAREAYAATEIKSLLLGLAGLSEEEPHA